MVGRKVRLQLDKAPPQPGEVRARGRASRPGRRRAACACSTMSSFELRAGEIVGIAGVSGNGQTELLQVLSGIRPPTERHGSRSAAATIDADHPGDPAEMRDARRRPCAGGPPAPGHGGGVPRVGDRDPGLSRASRRSAGSYLLRRPAVGAHCAELMERFDVRPRVPGLRSSSFSGGNQQKLVLAREMAREPKVLLVGQPTRGVDIGAIEFIHRELVEEPRRRLRRAGGLGRARRDPVAGRPHPGDVRRPHRRRGRAGRRRRAHARPDDGGAKRSLP